MKTQLSLISSILLLSQTLIIAEIATAASSVELTVYNGNFALVKEQRTITLQKGVNSIQLQDIAAKIDPSSILFQSKTAPNAVTILEQNYQYDLIRMETILNNSVGERITFTGFDENGKPYSQSGILLNPKKILQPRDNYNQPNEQQLETVIQTDDGQIVMNLFGQISLAKMPEGLYAKPTLNWLLDSQRSGSHEAELSYITDGVNWAADYIALVNSTDTQLDLTGWVTLTNNSGLDYHDARLTLMAGDVQRASLQAKDKTAAHRYSMEIAESRQPQFDVQSFFEYHMYKMNRSTTIEDKETKQISLLAASGIACAKEFFFSPRKAWWQTWQKQAQSGYKNPGDYYGATTNAKVGVMLTFENSVKNHAGMPLPKGNLRVYKLDEDGRQQFIGADEITHTPQDEKVRVYVGNTFDLVGEYKRTKYENIQNKSILENFQVILRNHKKETVTVKMIDYFWADWLIVESTHKHEQKDSNTVEFSIAVPAGGEAVMTYQVKTSW